MRMFCCLCLALVTSSAAQASVQINLGGPPLTGSGNTVPDDAITLLFENLGLNSVRLTIDVTGTSKKVKDILFNVNPLITGLSFLDGTGPNATMTYAANGKGISGVLTGFDINFAFATSGSNGDLWSGSPLAVFTITKTAGTATLTENSFSFTNPNGHFGAVHINNPNGTGGDSGKYGSPPDGVVPEATTFIIWSMLGLMGTTILYKRAGAD